MSDMKKRPVHKTERIRGLDGLRTLALFGVLLFHMFPQKVSGGYFGVIIFFVISGFLTAYSTVKKGRVSILSYYAKRMERIYPALILMLFISIEIISLVDKFKLLNVQEEVVSILLGYNNYWQISKSADYFANLSNTSAFTHLWYIAVLVQFELLWPWLYLVCRRSGKSAKESLPPSLRSASIAGRRSTGTHRKNCGHNKSTSAKR